MLRTVFQIAENDDLIRKNPFRFELSTVIVNDSVTRDAITRKQQRLSWVPTFFQMLTSPITVLSVASLEIFAIKTVALLTRTAPRDLYDMHNMVKYGLFDESKEGMLRKCAVFYSAIGVEQLSFLSWFQREVRKCCGRCFQTETIVRSWYLEKVKNYGIY